jgi:hypothetical protein
MPRGRLRSIARKRRHAYESMRAKGMAKSKAAAIANKGRTRAGRQAMARKAARTRARRVTRRR